MNEQLNTALPRSRLYIGGVIFVAGFAAPLLIPLVTSSNLASGWKTFLSGFLAFGIPEIFMLVAASVLGKQGFAYLKSKLWHLMAPPETVSLWRYRFGLVLLFTPILFIWVHPYLEQAQPWLNEKWLMLGLITVGMMAVSLFVLGGEFWDKLRGLFLYHVRVIQPLAEVGSDENKIAKKDFSLPTSRLVMGILLFILSLVLPVLIPFLSLAPLTDESRLVIGGLMVFGIPQLLMVLAIAFLGKSGFAYLKHSMSGLLRGLFSNEVSQGRYRLGLLLFVIPILVGITWPYLIIVFDSLSAYRNVVAITGDLILAVAVFVLGGEFLDKLISLFRCQSRVESLVTP